MRQRSTALNRELASLNIDSDMLIAYLKEKIAEDREIMRLHPRSRDFHQLERYRQMIHAEMFVAICEHRPFF